MNETDVRIDVDRNLTMAVVYVGVTGVAPLRCGKMTGRLDGIERTTPVSEELLADSGALEMAEASMRRRIWREYQRVHGLFSVPPRTIRRQCCSICGAEVRGATWTCEHVYADPVKGESWQVHTTRVLEHEYELVEGSERPVAQDGEG